MQRTQSTEPHQGAISWPTRIPTSADYGEIAELASQLGYPCSREDITRRLALIMAIIQTGNRSLESTDSDDGNRVYRYLCLRLHRIEFNEALALIRQVSFRNDWYKQANLSAMISTTDVTLAR